MSVEVVELSVVVGVWVLGKASAEFSLFESARIDVAEAVAEAVAETVKGDGDGDPGPVGIVKVSWADVVADATEFAVVVDNEIEFSLLVLVVVLCVLCVLVELVVVDFGVGIGVGGRVGAGVGVRVVAAFVVVTVVVVVGIVVVSVVDITRGRSAVSAVHHL